MDLPISEEICVSIPAPVGQIEAARGATVPRTIARTRATLVQGTPLLAVPSADLLAYLPPAPTSERFEVRAAAAVDPDDPSRGWVSVEGVAPIGKSDIPLRITVLLDVSSSMESVPTRMLPLLQDEVEPTRRTSRLDLAKAVLDELVRRMPPRGELALVAFEEDRARVLLQPTPAEQRDRIREAVARAVPGDAKGAREPLETVYDLAGSTFDPCADHRVLLITDDNAYLGGVERKSLKMVEDWAERGLELWTLSLGLLGQDAPPLDRLTTAGGGVHLYADTRSEAVEPLVAALRASGAVARDPAIRVDFGPRVVSWRRLDGVGGESSRGPDVWTLPTTIEGGWREARLYEVRLSPAPMLPPVDPPAPEAPAPPPRPPQPLGFVTWSAGSAVPGDWTRGDELPLQLVDLPDAAAFLRHRVYALRVAQATSAPTADWASLDALGRTLAPERGGALELNAWAHVLATGAKETKPR